MHGKNFYLTCSVALRGKLNAELLKTIKLKWEGPPGIAIMAQNNVTNGTQLFSSVRTTLQLSFGPLHTDHAGLYRCIVSTTVPSLVPYFNTEMQHSIVVTSE